MLPDEIQPGHACAYVYLLAHTLAFTLPPILAYLGAGPWTTSQVLTSNGRGGVVTCTIREHGDGGTGTGQRFWFTEHESVA